MKIIFPSVLHYSRFKLKSKTNVGNLLMNNISCTNNMPKIEYLKK